MCKCTPGIKTPWCGKPGCERPKQASPFPPQTSDADIPELARLLYNATLNWFLVLGGGRFDDGAAITAAASLLSGFLTGIADPARKAELIEGIYRALKTEHGIP